MSMTGISTPTCRYCGGWHNGVCPRIEEIEYHNDGTVKRVKLRAPVDVIGTQTIVAPVIGDDLGRPQNT